MVYDDLLLPMVPISLYFDDSLVTTLYYLSRVPTRTELSLATISMVFPHMLDHKIYNQLSFPFYLLHFLVVLPLYEIMAFQLADTIKNIVFTLK